MIRCFAIFLLCVSSCASGQSNAGQRPRAGDSVKPFSVQGIDGKWINFPGDFRGKVVILNFWATWCRPCMLEQNEIAAKMREYQGASLAVLGISMDHPGMLKKVLAAMDLKGMTWPQVYPAPEDIVAAYGADKQIPLTYLVNADTGQILTGDVSAYLSAAIDAAMVLKSTGANIGAPLSYSRDRMSSRPALTALERQGEREEMESWYNRKTGKATLVIDGAVRPVTVVSASTHGVAAEIYVGSEGEDLNFDVPMGNGTFPLVSMFEGNYASLSYSARKPEKITAESWDSGDRQFLKTVEGEKPGSGSISVRYSVVKEFSDMVALHINGTFGAVLFYVDSAGKVRKKITNGILKDIPYFIQRRDWEASAAYKQQKAGEN